MSHGPDSPTPMPPQPTGAAARKSGGRIAECLGELQLFLRAEGLEGWLLHDHRNQNGLAPHALGLEGRGFARRWFYWIPADGLPALLAHATELDGFGELPGDACPYDGWAGLRAGLEGMLPRRGLVAMEHQSMGGHPDLARVDAGTVELVESAGPRVVSSAGLVNRFLGPLGAHAEAMHALALAALVDVEEAVRAFLSSRSVTLESELRACARRAMATTGLEGGVAPLVATGPHTRQRVLCPSNERDRTLTAQDLVLVELVGRVPELGSPCAQRTWMGCVGTPTPEQTTAFACARAAREEAIALLEHRASSGLRLLGFEVDDAARRVLSRGVPSARVLHRTGHHVGRLPYSAEACTFDATEFHDVREALPGLAFCVEPGLYTDAFGVRTSATVLRTDDGVRRLDPGQDELTILKAP